MRPRPWGVLIAAALVLGGCAQGGFFDRLFGRRPPAPAAQVHAVVGEPYRIGGVWRYPRTSYTTDETGLAAVAGAHPPLTTDGELYDATAMAAGHRTLQLPAIARVSNLDTGLSVLVRLNDRGPASAARLVELTPRAATLIGARDGSPVRLQVLEGESRRLAAAYGGDGPKLDLAAAPAGTVTAEPLAAPAGSGAARPARAIRPAPADVAAPEAASAPVPLRLPEQVTQGLPMPGALFIDAGGFGRIEYARIMQARLAALGAVVSTDYAAPRDRAYVVRIGPFASVAEADAALERALAAGGADARIIVGQ